MDYNNNGLLPWLEGHRDDEITMAIHKYGIKHTYKNGDVIADQGEKLDKIYYLESGRVKVYMNTIDGSEKIFWYSLSGNFIGDVPFYHNMEPNAAIVAQEGCTVYTIDKNGLDSMLEDNPKIYNTLLKSMATKIRMLVHQIHDVSFNVPKARVCKLLFMLANTYSDTTKIGNRIKINITHREIASITSLHRVTVTNTFTQLKKDGIISKSEDGRIFVHDVKALKELSKIDEY